MKEVSVVYVKTTEVYKITKGVFRRHVTQAHSSNNQNLRLLPTL